MKKTLEGFKSCEDDSVFYTKVDGDIDSIYIKELLNILNNGNYQLKQQETEDGFDSSHYKFGVGNSYFLIEDTVLKNTLYLTQICILRYRLLNPLSGAGLPQDDICLRNQTVSDRNRKLNLIS